jgi:hypothetical protein
MEAIMDEPDIQRLIKELAATGIDPWYVYEAIAIEQEAAAERRAATAEVGAVAVAGSRLREPQMGQLVRLRPQLRVVVADRE